MRLIRKFGDIPAEIDKAAVGSRWRAVLAVWDVDTFKRRETLPRGPRRGRRAGFLAAGRARSLSPSYKSVLLNIFVKQDQPSEGLFTEGSFALVEGDYTENATFSVIAIGHPPCESRETAR